MYLDDNIEENQENPYQSLIRLHNSYSNSNERFEFIFISNIEINENLNKK